MSKKVFFSFFLFLLFIIASCSRVYVTYTLEAGEGGNVYGELIQTVESGSNLSQVYAEANAGYRFVGWSDGNLQNSRIDLNVSESQTIVAKFEVIMVYMYSDDLIVRKYKLNDLCNIDDLSKVVGYKSYNSFKNWNFINKVSLYLEVQRMHYQI